MIKFFLDANINSSLASHNLQAKDVKIFSFYDLSIRRREPDDIVAKIAFSHGIKLIITDEPRFASETNQEWRRLKEVSIIVPSDPLIRVFRQEKHSAADKQILKEFVQALKDASHLSAEFFVIEIRQHPQFLKRLELLGKEPRRNT